MILLFSVNSLDPVSHEDPELLSLKSLRSSTSYKTIRAVLFIGLAGDRKNTDFGFDD